MGRLLPRAIGLIHVLLAPLLVALCAMDLNASVRNQVGESILSTGKLVSFGKFAQSENSHLPLMAFSP